MIDGYTYLPSGPITHNEVIEYNANIVKDHSHNSIIGLKQKVLVMFVKKRGEKDFSRYRLYRNQDNGLLLMDTLAQELAIDDSLMVSITYAPTSDFKGTTRDYRYQTVMKYAVKTETIAALIRKGEELITIFPNPCINETIVKLDVSEKLTASYYVLDGFGRTIKDGKLQDIREEIHIDLKDHPSTTYVFYILIDTEIFKKKIVKLKL
ncbi:MAG: hypothetical protein COA58_05285 [Bacteroidetes bacterium]|nr:MAG: hypothetical protein COA58_05285 [Bacteroidota bacterium]